MAPIQIYLFIFNLLAFAHSAPIPPYLCDCTGVPLERSSFPPDFVFGAAGSAYQMEGAWNISGKGPSIWDTFTHTYPEKIADHSNGDVATDSYNLYKTDVLLAKALGVDVYRFSISWTRILPQGKITGGVNQLGIDYYNNLIDELLANGIEPCVTIFHWDVPQPLEDLYGGFLSPRIVDDFVDYVDVVFSNFGDRVRTWITLNEPWSFSNFAYAVGTLAPGRCNFWYNPDCTGGDPATEPYIVTHHQLLAHAAAYRLYQNKYKAVFNGSVGITLVTEWYEPYDPKNSSDMTAAAVQLDFSLGWFAEPLAYGRYPHHMKRNVGNRLPRFTAQESKMLKKSYDFLGLNYYTAKFARFYDKGYKPEYLSYTTDPGVNLTVTDVNGNPMGEGPAYNTSWIEVYPIGLRKLLTTVKNEYDDPTIFITENGVCTDSGWSLLDSLNDTIRTNYLSQHLCCVHEAIAKYNVSVEGFIAWSLLDNFEWSAGYTDRFGLYFVDFESQTRIPKFSSKWYNGVLTNNPEQLSPDDHIREINPIQMPIRQQNPIQMPIRTKRMHRYSYY